MSDPRPTTSPITETVYAALPELYRDADAAQDTGPSNFPLLRYLSLVLDQLEPIAELTTRLTYIAQDERGDEPDTGRMGVPEPWQRFGHDLFGDGSYGDADTSDLVDPRTADAAWLPWLAQLLGVSIRPSDTTEETRDRLANAQTAWGHGTPTAIIDLIRRALVDPDAYVDVQPNADGPFVINIITPAEAAGGAGATWALLEAYDTWSGVYAGRGTTWAALRGVDILDVVEPERPAGYRFIHTDLEDYTP